MRSRRRSANVVAALGRRLGKNRHELLAAIPRDDVDLAHRVLEQRAQLSQHAVAGEVADGVVDPLEMVDVEQQQRERRVVAPRPVDLGGQPVEQRAPVENARQRIGRRQRLEPPIVGARALQGLRAADDRHGRAEHHVGERDVLHASERARRVRFAGAARPSGTDRCRTE